MGWLDNLNEDRIFKYLPLDEKNPCEAVTGNKKQLSKTFAVNVEGIPGEVLKDPKTEYRYAYAGFEPVALGLVTKVVFEKNGRKAIRIKDQEGKTTTRSMSRENLLNGKGVTITGEKRDAKGELTGKKSYEVTSSLTKACREQSNEVTKHEVVKRVKVMQHQVKHQAHLDKEKRKGKK